MWQRIVNMVNRPLAEDFGFRNQFWSSVWGGLYVAAFLWIFGMLPTRGGLSPAGLAVLIGLGVMFATLVANWLVPKLLPRFYDEDCWTLGRHALHTLLVLFCISVMNQVVLWAVEQARPPFGYMYGVVTLIGFFPIILSVLLAEQRRLRRNLAHARMLNDQFTTLHRPAPNSLPRPASNVAPAELPKPVLLVGENQKERLSLLPNQLLYVESIGNYVEVHWLNFMLPQKTVLRSTLKAVEEALADHPQMLRCHRAFLVNLRAVRQTEGNARGYQLTLSGSGRAVPVSRSYVAAFDARLAQLSAETGSFHSSQNQPE